MHVLRRGLVTAACLLAITLGTTSCGTVLITNEFSASIADPGRRLPGGPTEISIFDSAMGQCADWAQTSMGSTSLGQPYTTSFKSTATKFVGDGSPSQQVRAGVSIPQYQSKGYFALQLSPVDGQSITLQAPFIGYYDYSAASDGAVKPLPMTVTAKSADQAWQLTVVITIPAK